MIGTIQYVNEKEGKKGKYLTLALEDGTKGLVVNDEKIMEAVKEGETYDFTVAKSGIFTIVTGIASITKTNTYAEDVKTAEKLQEDLAPKQKKPQYKVGSPPTGGYKPSEYMKKRTPKETEIIAKQAFAKALIEAYARLWIADKSLFDTLGKFNEQVRDEADDYVQWLKIEEK